MKEQPLKAKPPILPFLGMEKAPDGTDDTNHKSKFRDHVAAKVLSMKPVFTDEEIDEMLQGTGTYRDELEQAFEVLYLGQVRTAVFLVGRTLEAVTRQRFRSRRIPGMTVKGKQKLTWNDILETLKKKNIIDKSTYDRMSTVKSDRNVGGHPAAPEAVEQLEGYARQTIEMGIKLIKDILNGKIL
ncbi:hypothetical protein J2Z79_001194 [Symbiobacterium terraclitae]|uniref:DUF4145 domain-containing protein n=1 Tax=Symbiobacterium terraclitae TaxID=557451 RepID=A0ABS4JTM4_9FIRM|nr:hypothetical protein [Symbiobacterium terraclitae]MBP2017809.1 hypothetical protein [Symbiobacterium terraclitae]